MIKIVNVENVVKFECDIVGYQFPKTMNDNWLLMRVKIEQNDKSFDKIDAALEASELIFLYEWFNCLLNCRLPEYSHLTFTEPCISFEFLAYKNSMVRIAIELSWIFPEKVDTFTLPF